MKRSGEREGGKAEPKRNGITWNSIKAMCVVVVAVAVVGYYMPVSAVVDSDRNSEKREENARVNLGVVRR